MDNWMIEYKEKVHILHIECIVIQCASTLLLLVLLIGIVIQLVNDFAVVWVVCYSIDCFEEQNMPN